MDIEIEGGGKRLIRVTDNGTGMDPDDAVLAFERHATSKLARAEDLASVATLGFRGEALASIAAVASVEVRTRMAGSPTGTLVRVSWGGVPSAVECAATVGTSVTVSGLFSNMPARLKFLKGDSAEAARIADVAYSMALGNPRVSFSLKIDGNSVVRTQGTGSLGDAIASLFGVALLRDMLPVGAVDASGESAPVPAVRVSGFAARPGASRASRAAQYLFVNGRHVRSYAVRGAVEEAYRGLIHGRRFPVFFLEISLPFESVDVNIHPQKAEIKFLREREITAAVYSAVRRAILGEAAPAAAAPAAPAQRQVPGMTGHPVAAARGAGETRLRDLPGIYTAEDSRGEAGAAPARAGLSLRDVRVVGQVFDSYVVAESRDGLVLVDQHAAHERVCYEGLLEARGRHATQPLLSPQVLEIAPRDFEGALEALDALSQLGFDVAPFGNNTLLIRGVPAGLDSGACSDMVMAALGAASSAPRGSNPVEVAAAALAACHSAVRAGRRLSPAEMTALVTDLGATRRPLQCPHGRPTAVEIRVEEIEKRFGRR